MASATRIATSFGNVVDDGNCPREWVGKMSAAARKVLDDLVGEFEDLEREWIDVEAFVVERHRVREGERERGEVPP